MKARESRESKIMRERERERAAQREKQRETGRDRETDKVNKIMKIQASSSVPGLSSALQERKASRSWSLSLESTSNLINVGSFRP